MERNNKEEKEAFVTGHVGTTIWEIMLVSLPGPFGIILCQYLYLMMSQKRKISSWGGSNFIIVLFLVEAAAPNTLT